MSLFKSKYINKIPKTKKKKKQTSLKTLNKIAKPGKVLEDII